MEWNRALRLVSYSTKEGKRAKMEKKNERDLFTFPIPRKATRYILKYSYLRKKFPI